MNYLLPLLILTPLATGIAILLSGGKNKSLVPLGIAGALLTLVLSAWLTSVVHEAERTSDVAGVSPRVVFAPEAMRFSLPIASGNYPIEWQLAFGADGISAMLVFLTGIVGFITILLASRQIQTRLPQYIALLLLSMSMLIGVFLAMDLVSFYVFFEAVLIPLVLLINGWGNGQAPWAASKKFLLFTLAGSIPMVIGLIGLAMSPVNMESGSLSRPSTISLMELSQYASEAALSGSPWNAGTHGTWILWLLMLGFGIKLAILPLHSWLPTTYAAAHPNTTAMIAAVVAKLGLYGILRIVIPLTPVTLAEQAQLLFGALGSIAIVYGALVALTQTDLRSVLAYSSLSHVGFITVGLMSLTSEGLAGATLQMFNHGLITASMFWILSMLEQRRGRIQLSVEDQGMAAHYPKLAVLLIFFVLAGAGLPGLNGFVGEYLAMSGMMRVSWTIVAIAVLGTVLGAWYGLRIVQRLLFGGERHGHAHHHAHHEHRHAGHTEGKHGDLTPVEWVPLASVALLCLMIGLFPQRNMELFIADTDRLAKLVEPVAKRAHPNIDTLAIVDASASELATR